MRTDGKGAHPCQIPFLVHQAVAEEGRLGHHASGGIPHACTVGEGHVLAQHIFNEVHRQLVLVQALAAEDHEHLEQHVGNEESHQDGLLHFYERNEAQGEEQNNGGQRCHGAYNGQCDYGYDGNDNGVDQPFPAVVDAQHARDDAAEEAASHGVVVASEQKTVVGVFGGEHPVGKYDHYRQVDVDAYRIGSGYGFEQQA